MLFINIFHESYNEKFIEREKLENDYSILNDNWWQPTNQTKSRQWSWKTKTKTPTECNQILINWILILCTLFTFHSIFVHSLTFPYFILCSYSLFWIGQMPMCCRCVYVHLLTPKFYFLFYSTIFLLLFLDIVIIIVGVVVFITTCMRSLCGLRSRAHTQWYTSNFGFLKFYFISLVLLLLSLLLPVFLLFYDYDYFSNP